jgi:DNA invertase Pin-like site-specific DNA recombinase
MNIGYARISQAEQSLDLQCDALTKAGCSKIFTDTLSGAHAVRPGLSQALEFARQGDALVVWRLDRLGRSLPHLIDTMRVLDERGIGFRSLCENIDTTTVGGRLAFNIFASIAEFERGLIRERTRAGLEAARERGRVGGRPRSMTGDKIDAARKLLDSGTPPKDVARLIGVSPATLYRWVPAVARAS